MNQPGAFVHWSIFDISVANLVLIAVMVAIVGAAPLLPFPLVIWFLGLFGVLLISTVATWFTLRHQRAAQRLPGLMVSPFERVLSRALSSHQAYSWAGISPATG